jgi:hypothetical protein
MNSKVSEARHVRTSVNERRFHLILGSIPFRGPQAHGELEALVRRMLRPREAETTSAGPPSLPKRRVPRLEIAARWCARKVRGEDRERPYRVDSWVVGARACLPGALAGRGHPRVKRWGERARGPPEPVAASATVQTRTHTPKDGRAALHGKIERQR